MNLAEELLLLALHNQKGAVLSSAGSSLLYGLAGATLLELTFRGKLHPEQGTLVVIDGTSTGDQILDQVLLKLQNTKRARSPRYWINRLKRRLLKSDLLKQLVHKGILRREEERILGLFPVQRYLIKDASVEQEIKNRIRAVVLNSMTPNPQTAALISLVNACSLVSELFVREERTVARRRMKAIAEGEQVGQAIASTVAEVQTAVTVAIVSSIAASSAASNSASSSC